jgi:hypothetical protein
MANKKSSLTQYLFWDRSGVIANGKGKIIASTDSEEKYYLWSRAFPPRIEGGMFDPYNTKTFSKEPQEGQHLLTYRGLFQILGRQRISTSKIREINRDISLCFQ